jgi:hypothetical protein
MESSSRTDTSAIYKCSFWINANSLSLDEAGGDDLTF